MMPYEPDTTPEDDEELANFVFQGRKREDPPAQIALDRKIILAALWVAIDHWRHIAANKRLNGRGDDDEDVVAAEAKVTKAREALEALGAFQPL